MNDSRTGRDIRQLTEPMGQLQLAIRNISANWNDAVSAAIQSAYINGIISACNSINAELGGMAGIIDSTLEELDKLKLNR